MIIWFTADLHLNHANILAYCNRPFKNVGAMDEAIIERWNKVVQPDDTVYVLGDFAFGKYAKFRRYIARLNGQIAIIPGGHDKMWVRYYQGGIQSMSGQSIIILDPLVTIYVDKQPIVLCHYAMRTWEKSHYGSWHLYGHSHGNLPDMNLSMDIGVDSHNFYPVSYDKILKVMSSRKAQGVGYITNNIGDEE